MVPIWGQIVGVVLILVFVLAGFEAFAGPGIRLRLLSLVAGGSSQTAPVPTRVLYQPESSARIGMQSTGSEGQERTLLAGDAVLLGDSGRIVRLEAGGRIADVPAADGATTLVANLGAWERGADRLTGATARAQAGR